MEYTTHVILITFLISWVTSVIFNIWVLNAYESYVENYNSEQNFMIYAPVFNIVVTFILFFFVIYRIFRDLLKMFKNK